MDKAIRVEVELAKLGYFMFKNGEKSKWKGQLASSKKKKGFTAKNGDK